METLLDPHEPTAQVAGRRLVRMLGSGRRWSAFSTVVDKLPEASEGSGTQRAALLPDAVLLRARADAAERSLWRRAAILARLDHPHVLRLLDVAEDLGGGPCLLVERLPGGTVAELLRRRETIAPGEAVTILAPLIDAVRAAHLVGVHHGAISASAVSFASDGRPVLAGWCEAGTSGDASSRGELSSPMDPAFLADWVALGGLIDGVLATTSAALLPNESGWISESAPVLTDHELANRLQQRMYALARPLPILLDRGPVPVDSPATMLRASASTAPDAPVVRTRRSLADARRRPRIGARVQALGRRRRPPQAAASNPPPVDASSAAISRRRGKLILAATAAAAVLASGALLLMPGDGQAIPAKQAGFEEEPAPPLVTVAPTGAPGAAATLPAPADEDQVPRGADDPVAATVALLAARERCRQADTAAACVLDYAERDSALADDERTDESLGAITIEDVVLVDRQGDAAVLRSTAAASPGGDPAHEQRQPVTLLVVRGETGWRLREVFIAG